MMTRFCIFIVFYCLCGHLFADTAGLMQQRLALMQAVAAYKWHHQLPIEDLQRETIVLNAAVDQGLKYNIKADSSQRFFQLQINAAKEIQQYWFDYWRLSPANEPSEILDLASVIRPRLIELGTDITKSLAGQSGKPTTTATTLNIKGLKSETAAKLIQAIRHIERYNNLLDQILHTGVIRIGTTGDYAPFSYADQNQKYTGIDIDMAQDLAASLDAKIEWVHTSWPDLMPHLKNRQFHIAMSGISINLQRQRTGYFTRPYHTGGKTPIIRCTDIGQYQSLEAIDQPQVNIIVNPGGTNEIFLRQNIQQANIAIFSDNRYIFDQLISSKADLMITDQIEVQLQTAKHPALCAALPNRNFTFSEKGYLLPPDETWKNYIDLWLDLRIKQGKVKEIFATHLGQ
ncbi:MAG: gamma subclass chorismate mutase AroQ [Pseudomonadales bacterium]|nr:gamma subclass chorismate mutase AroQ [Pseudomonadales bacterium]